MLLFALGHVRNNFKESEFLKYAMTSHNRATEAMWMLDRSAGHDAHRQRIRGGGGGGLQRVMIMSYES